MPFASQAQARWAFANKKKWARKWGHKTRLAGGIDKLPQYVARKDRKWGKRQVVAQKDVPNATPALGNASGPGGLFSHPGLDSASRHVRTWPRKYGKRLRPQIHMKAEGEGHSGAMVALYLPSQAAQCVGQAGSDLFCDRAEKPCDLHITIAYLGKMDDIEDQLPQIVATIQSYIRIWAMMIGQPIPATIGGYKAFDKEQDDGSIPIYREVHSPELMVFVDGLERMMAMSGTPVNQEYGAYTPHVTVAYSYPELVPLLATAPATHQTVQFEQVALRLGDIQIDLPLFAPPTYKAVATDSAPAAKPGDQGQAKPKPTSSGGGGREIRPGVIQVRGNLCHVHGQFGPCDKATADGFMGKPKKGGKGKGGKGGGGKAAKPKLTDEEKRAKHQADVEARRAEADQQKVVNRTNALAAMPNRPNDQAMAALDALQSGGQTDEAMLTSIEKTGLVAKHADGTHTLSPSGHALLNALAKGDVAAANEAITGGGDKVAASTAQDQARAQRQADREKRQQDIQSRQAAAGAKKPPKANTSAEKPSTSSGSSTGSSSSGGSNPSGSHSGGGSGSSSGGGGSSSASAPKAPTKPSAPTGLDAAAQTAKHVTAVAEATDLGDNLSNLDQIDQGKMLKIRPQDQEYLINQGLLRLNTANVPQLTDNAKVLLSAARSGDIKAANEALTAARANK